jgi:hypothetical protein
VYKKFRVYIAKYKRFTNNKHYFNGTPVSLKLKNQVGTYTIVSCLDYY